MKSVVRVCGHVWKSVVKGKGCCERKEGWVVKWCEVCCGTLLRLI